MVFCPNCGADNDDAAKFCKRCGNTLKGSNPIKDTYVSTGNAPSARNDNSNLNSNSNNNNSKSDNKNLLIICLTIVICAILIAGALIFFSADDNDDGSSLSDSASLNGGSENSVNTASDDATGANTVAQVSSPRIYSGSFSTGSSASDKTHCTVYVGSEHAGEKVKISVLYSNDGYALNQGKVVPKTVSSDGYVKVASADAFSVYPDEAYITLYDSNGDILDTRTVYLNENSGKQVFN